MRRIVRRASLLVSVSFLAVACSTSYADATADAGGVVLDASSETGVEDNPDASAPSDASADAREELGPCIITAPPLKLALAFDAVLDGAHLDAGASRFCDLASATCLLAFDLGTFAGRRIGSATIMLRRAIGNDCEAPTDCSVHTGSGTMDVQNMRTDWTANASYAFRTPNSPWDSPGASGANDTGAITELFFVAGQMTVASPVVGANALDPRFIGADQHVLAFRIRTTEQLTFLIRRVEYAVPAALDLPTLSLQLCD